MKKWEDIFKDKLGGMEITLPEGSLAEFRTRLDEAESASPMKRFPFGWVMAAAVAAGLAAILFLHQPTVPENGIQIIQQPKSSVTVTSDSTEIYETAPAQMLIAQASMPKPIVHPVASSKEPVIEESHEKTEETVPDKPVEDSVGTETLDTSTPETQNEKKIDNPVEASTSPFIPSDLGTKNVRLKVVHAAGIVGGGSFLAAIITPTIWPSRSITKPIHGNPIKPGDSAQQKDDYSHSFPLIVGLSTKIPLSDRLSLTSGLDYSVYSSKFTYSISGEKIQVVRYLGIPARLDLSMASNRWLDVYVGGGLRGDYCINASLAGTPIKKDGLSFSILGSGGIQFNATPLLGIYVEPEISYLIPYKSYCLETYRTNTPLMFSVKSGVRITFSTKRLNSTILF